MAALFSKPRNYFLNAGTLLSLFDTYSGSMLNYGCEVWISTYFRCEREH